MERLCYRCEKMYEPDTHWQRFCTAKCRNDWHAAERRGGKPPREKKGKRLRPQLLRPLNCDICKMQSAIKRKKSGRVVALHQDHNHKTGKLRGFLCNHCNLALGGFRDNKQILLDAIEYLEKCAMPTRAATEGMTPR